MDKVQKYNSFNTNTPSSESYRKVFVNGLHISAIILHSLDIWVHVTMAWRILELRTEETPPRCGG